MTKVMLGILLLAGSAPLAWAAEPQGQDRAFLDKALTRRLGRGGASASLPRAQADSDAVKAVRPADDGGPPAGQPDAMDLARQQGSKEASGGPATCRKLEPGGQEVTLATRSEGLTGREVFDQTYMRDMILRPREAVALFPPRGQGRARTSELRQTRPSPILPTLEEHLKMAREVGSQAKGSGEGGGGGGGRGGAAGGFRSGGRLRGFSGAGGAGPGGGVGASSRGCRGLGGGRRGMPCRSRGGGGLRVVGSAGRGRLGRSWAVGGSRRSAGAAACREVGAPVPACGAQPARQLIERGRLREHLPGDALLRTKRSRSGGVVTGSRPSGGGGRERGLGGPGAGKGGCLAAGRP